MKVAIIGAGISGITACKESVACGLLPTVFEQHEGYGGNWNPKSGKTWNSIRSNISKYTFMYSDFPYSFLKQGEDFATTNDIYRYLGEYIKEFQIEKYFRFQSIVLKACYKDEKWNITYRYIKTGQEHQMKFDFLIVASGVFDRPLPYEGIIEGVDLEKFKESGGKVIHSLYYKDSEEFRGKRVLVVGNGNSGCDIVTDLIRQPNTEVYHYFRRNYWICGRYIPNGNKERVPLDWVFYSRLKQDASLKRSETEKNLATNSFFEKISPLQLDIESIRIPKDQYNTFIPLTICDGYLENLRDNKFKVERNPQALINSNQIDIIIFCNGFSCSLDFLDSDTQKRLQFQSDSYQTMILYKECIPPLDMKGLAFVGVFRGTYTTVLELQARMVTMMLSGQIPYPSQETMTTNLNAELDIRYAIPRKLFPHPDYVNFADSIARVIQCLPDFEKLKETDPELYNRLYNLPHNCSCYRLVGPHSKPKLAEMLLNQFLNDVDSRK
ncbi:hypothetical protein DLAC_08927 [Tieghemostelium lacteum]|uniref:Flavin-containing monooxygenase n=1 Tax=Tieghemostelium lacteum TaxID=361077 RepID=A0A151Z8M7_TIELA|nr:hypothetical protein DLAC_08927 [Tieghemostelium lacteum]|eukprot:KYQ90323.1 hypothetical protein DLAC_08927 [Tieghemostelium lacteum]